ncbi:MAG: phytanoyl-CoA dioxygenase family protein [Spirochaetaceae bacterium]|nr:phytanoyl-CoA dioxygenase family protein [Spirochaetaceae bacterium]MDE0218014.1 phytanoyl-CoA dioxygenase family protein [Spirochaetaceae bacterium]
MATETLVSAAPNGSAVSPAPLAQADVDFFHENGFLRIPSVFTPEESQAQADDLDRLAHDWATIDRRWPGPWRKVYMDDEEEKAAKLEAMHELHFYSRAWLDAVTSPRLIACLVPILGPDIELHHSVMHTKPPGGQVFPMHQDHPFYPHDDGRYLDVLVHLDDTCHENGEIRFLAGSHKQGALEHITGTEEEPSAPHLPTEKYRLADSVPVPARRGDLVVFSYYTIHGSYINRTDRSRRMVRVGYRHPHNPPSDGAVRTPGLLVSGYRERRGDEAQLF